MIHDPSWHTYLFQWVVKNHQLGKEHGKEKLHNTNFHLKMAKYFGQE